MPSPFPGMDPYLEDDCLWPPFHHQFVLCLYQILTPGLVDRYRARIVQRGYVTEQALFTSVLRELSDRTQFVVVSHNRATMEAARALYGISMDTGGVSTVVSLKLPAEDAAPPEPAHAANGTAAP